MKNNILQSTKNQDVTPLGAEESKSPESLKNKS